MSDKKITLEAIRTVVQEEMGPFKQEIKEEINVKFDAVMESNDEIIGLLKKKDTEQAAIKGTLSRHEQRLDKVEPKVSRLGLLMLAYFDALCSRAPPPGIIAHPSQLHYQCDPPRTEADKAKTLSTLVHFRCAGMPRFLWHIAKRARGESGCTDRSEEVPPLGGTDARPCRLARLSMLPSL